MGEFESPSGVRWVSPAQGFHGPLWSAFEGLYLEPLESTSFVVYDHGLESILFGGVSADECEGAGEGLKARNVKPINQFILIFCVLLSGCENTGSDEGTIICSYSESPPPLTPSVPLLGNPFDIEVVTQYMGLQMECVVLEDLDRDGHLDLALARSGYISFEEEQEPSFVNEMIFLWGEGNRAFTTETLAFPDGASPTTGCSALDLNEDGTLDLVVGTAEGNLAAVLQHTPREFDVVADIVTLPEDANGQRMVTIIPMDLDGEGAPDLIVGTFAVIDPFCVGLEEDPGGGKDVSFSRPMVIPAQIHCLVAQSPLTYVEAPAGICPSNITSLANGPTWAGLRADLNHDGRADVLMTVDYASNVLLLSGPDGSLHDAAASSGLSTYNHGMGLGLADFDGDGLRDLFVADTGPDQLWRGTGCGTFEDISATSGVAKATDRGYGWGVTAADFDHDGDVDVFVTNSFVTGENGWLESNLCKQILPGDPLQAHFFLENDGSAQFQRRDIPLNMPLEFLRTPVTKASGDLDRDGDMDVVVIENRMLHIYWNEAEKSGDWLMVRPLEKSGLPAVGSRVRVIDGNGESRWQDVYGSHGRDGHSALEAHFGLGTGTNIVDVQVVWSDGSVSQASDQETNRLVTVTRSQ
jgi:hypothetical protein